MERRLLASAILTLAASGSALAESGVTLYGNIDASVVTATGIGDPNGSRRWSFGEGNWAPSVWGLKGTEDLGSGMKAHFRLEGGFSSANGAIANGGTTGVFSRMANAGISGPFGSITAGLNFEAFKFENTFTPTYYGQYVFNSLQDFKDMVNQAPGYDTIELRRYALT